MCPLEEEVNTNIVEVEASEYKKETESGRCSTGDDSTDSKSDSVDITKLIEPPIETQNRVVETWCQTRPSLNAIEIMMSSRVKNKITKDEKTNCGGDYLPPIKEASVENSEDEEACFSEGQNRSTFSTGAENRVDECISNNVKPSERDNVVGDEVSQDHQLFPWKAELECLVRGGLPKDLRGEVKLEF